MKRFFIPIAAAMIATSCSTETKDPFDMLTYNDYNLIVDTANPDQKAQATYCGYETTFFYTKNALSIKANDLIVDNQKYSFETDTIGYGTTYFKTMIDGEETPIINTVFSKPGSTGIGSVASDMKGELLGIYTPSTKDTLSSTFKVYLTARLDLNYTLSNRYKVQTFWHNSLYIGQTYASDTNETFNSRNPKYMVSIDFPNGKATVFIYNSELSASPNTLPTVIRIGDIPVLFDHSSYYLQAEKPKTTVLGKRNNSPALIDSVGFQVEDFSLRLMSEDLTDANITYKLNGKSVTFTGSSGPKPGR